MRKLLFGMIVLVSLALSAAGYSWLQRDEGPAILVVGAGPYRTDSHDLMKEVAEVVARHSENLVIQVRATSDPSQNISLLNRGEIDLATIRSDTPVVNDVRLVANLFSDYFQIITRSDSGINSITDLQGKNVAVPEFGTDEFKSFWIIGDHYDLSLSQVRWQAMPFQKAILQLLNGKMDALFTVRSLRDRVLIRLFEDAKLKRLRLNLLEIDQAEAIAIKRPFLQVGRIPKGAYSGANPLPQRDTNSTSVDRILVTRSAVNEDAIAELTRVLFEHRLDLTIRFALASAIKKPDVSIGLSVPLHAGSARYFNRDQPSFIQENAEPMALMITIAAMLVSAMLALRSWLTARQKNRLDSYNYVLLEIADKARSAEHLETLRELKNKLFEILNTVVRALDTDEMTEEGFQSFSLLWESVRETINDRQRELEPSRH